VIVNPTSGSPAPERAASPLDDWARPSASSPTTSRTRPSLEWLEELHERRSSRAPKRCPRRADAPLLDEIRRDCHAVLVAGFD
jgi:hypothetical protein